VSQGFNRWQLVIDTWITILGMGENRHWKLNDRRHVASTVHVSPAVRDAPYMLDLHRCAMVAGMWPTSRTFKAASNRLHLPCEGLGGVVRASLHPMTMPRAQGTSKPPRVRTGTRKDRSLSPDREPVQPIAELAAVTTAEPPYPSPRLATESSTPTTD
jgi:hypothetical protein